MSNTLKFGNGQWATKDGSVLAYNDENDNFKPLPFNFERASSATLVNKDGLIEQVGSGEPRIDYTDSADGVLLLEPSKTNLILNSQKISLTPTKSGNFVDNFAISPDGTQNATKLTSTSTDPYFYQNVTFSAADYTSSLYIKGIGDSIGKEFRFNIKGITHSSNKYVIPSEWKRFDFTATVTSGSGSVGVEIPDPSVIGDEVLIWGWQIEQGTYPTSYIPTNGSVATRLADECNNGANEQVINSSEGVLYFEGSALEEGVINRHISLSDSTASNRIQLVFSSTANRLRITSKLDSIDYYSSAQTDNNKVAFSYSASGIKFYVNGVFAGSATGDASFPANTLTTLDYALYNQTSSPFYGNVKDVRVYNTALTDSELQQLTS